jgi:hypothetical protein
VVQLTEAPLDLEQPGHVDALVRAYKRFGRLAAGA